MGILFILSLTITITYSGLILGCSYSSNTPENALRLFSQELKQALRSDKEDAFFGKLKSIKSRNIARELDNYEKNVNQIWSGKAKTPILTECEYEFEITKNLKGLKTRKSIKVIQTLWSRRTKDCESHEVDNLGHPIGELSGCIPMTERSFYSDKQSVGSVDLNKERLYTYSNKYGITGVHYRKFSVQSDSELESNKKSMFEKNLLAVIDNILNSPSIEEINCFKSEKNLPPEYYYFSDILGPQSFKQMKANRKLIKDGMDFANLQQCQTYYIKQRSRSISEIAERLDISF